MAQIAIGTATSAEDYIDRRAERLVVEGCRLLTDLTDASPTPSLSVALRLYQKELGACAGAEAAAALERFMTSLKLCVSNPLAAYRPGSRFISPDDCRCLELSPAFSTGMNKYSVLA